MILFLCGRLKPWAEGLLWGGLFLLLPSWSKEVFFFRAQFLVHASLFTLLHWKIMHGMQKAEDDPAFLGLQTGFFVGEWTSWPEGVGVIAYTGGRLVRFLGWKALLVYQSLWAHLGLLLQLRHMERWQGFRFFSLYQGFEPTLFFWGSLGFIAKWPWLSALCLLKMYGPTGLVAFLLKSVPDSTLWLFRLVVVSELVARWTQDPQALYLNMFCSVLSLLFQK